jgi:hypothetical protein
VTLNQETHRVDDGKTQFVTFVQPVPQKGFSYHEVFTASHYVPKRPAVDENHAACATSPEVVISADEKKPTDYFTTSKASTQ